MSGQAIISINENEWAVSLATTYAELTTGLSGVASLAPGTGMLFILPAKQQVTVDTNQMLFPIDIIFISDDTVIDIASNVQPGYLVTEETPCDLFLEVNAGEAAGVEVGDTVSTATIQQPGFDLSSIISFAIPVAVLGFVCAMAGGVMKVAGGSSSPGHSSPKQISSGKITKHYKGPYLTNWQYGGYSYVEEDPSKKPELWPHGMVDYVNPDEVIAIAEREGISEISLASGFWEEIGYKGYGEKVSISEAKKALAEARKHVLGNSPAHPAEKITVKCPICGKEIEVPEYDRVSRSEALRKHIKKEHGGHHSMWLSPEQRKGLEEKYGAVAVRWAEEATRPGDIKGVEAAAEYYYGKLKEVFGLGHLSPALTEEQLRKLREVLGLTASAAEVLRIHEETGYIP